MRRVVWSLLLGSCVMPAACGPPKEIEPPATASAEITCPPPVGVIRREACSAAAEEWSTLSVAGALKQAGNDALGTARVDAIRAVATLAGELKESRTALCEAYNACRVPPAQHAAKDQALAQLMTALVDLWGERRLADVGEIARFHAAVHAIGLKLAQVDPSRADGRASAPAATASVQSLTGDKLTPLSLPGIDTSTEAGAVTVRAPSGGLRQVLRSSPALRLLGGSRYLIKVLGSYASAAPPVLAPGDEITVRARYRAEQANELYVALKSLEDADALEGTIPWNVVAGERGTREATLTARAGESGFYVALGARRAGAVWLDELELLRGGRVLASLRAQPDSPAAKAPSRAPEQIKAQPQGDIRIDVGSTCTVAETKALPGKRSLRCATEGGDLVTLAAPTTYLELAVRGSSGDRAVLRTQSLEGGRSLDARLTDDAELVLSMAGAGTATIRSIEVRAIRP